MNSRLIQAICQQLAQAFESKNIPQRQVYDSLQFTEYSEKDLPIFIGDLIDKAQEYDLTMVSTHAPPHQLASLVQDAQYPILYFEKKDTTTVAVLGGRKQDGTPLGIRFLADGSIETSATPPRKPYLWHSNADTAMNGQALYLTAFPMQSMVSEDEPTTLEPLTPVRRFFRLLANEKKDIGYIYLYAIVIGLVTLSLPLGIQALINLISGGMVFSSVYLLLVVVIGGVFISGVMQIIQFTLVETLQQRIFAKAAFEFTYRIPRVKAESLLGYYPPELMNRFFDVLAIQKGLPKILIEITGAILQILLGIMLLSFYHPFFIAFGFLTIMIVALIIYFNGPKGLQTSLVESKYKYRVAQWLEDIARSLSTFKLSGTGHLPMKKMDGLVNSYLLYRKKHFKILKIFFWNAVIFKTVVIGGMLALGTFLVVERQISLGQFVATEIIIILLTNSVEKLIQGIDTIFDVLTAVEKLGNVTDLPLEREQGFRLAPQHSQEGLFLKVTDLKYTFEGRQSAALNGLSFSLNPGESVCVTGTDGSGKKTLLNVLSGLLENYQGGITFNGISMRDLNMGSLRSYIEQNIAVDDIFAGTILENITMGRDHISLADLEWILDLLNLTDPISKLPDGLSSIMLPGGRSYADSFIAKITLARSMITRPKILMVNYLLHTSTDIERLRLMQELTKDSAPWSLLILSNDSMIMQQCDRVMMMDAGRIVCEGKYSEIKNHEAFVAEFAVAR